MKIPTRGNTWDSNQLISVSYFYHKINKHPKVLVYLSRDRSNRLEDMGLKFCCRIWLGLVDVFQEEYSVRRSVLALATA